MTDVRLVASGNPNHNCLHGLEAISTHPSKKGQDDTTTVRLVAGDNKRRDGSPRQKQLAQAFTKEDDTTTVRLVGAAWDGANDQITTGVSPREGNQPGHQLPALLVSYFYWEGFARYRPRYAFRDYALDSGAYSAHTSGAEIDLDQYIAFCQGQLASDPQCTEVFALDVIDSWRQSERNTERMWKAGVPAIPVYHFGEPERLLTQMASAYPKIALGGMVGQHAVPKLEWLEWCFAKVWPKKIHGLGVSGENILQRLPFHSVDATNWIVGPAGFGSYKSMAKPTKAPRGKGINLRAEVQWWLALERKLAQRWRKPLALLDALPPVSPLYPLKHRRQRV
jgi:hypothetical protein